MTFKSLSDEDHNLFKQWLDSKVTDLESGFFKYEQEDKEFSESISNALYIIERMNL